MDQQPAGATTQPPASRPKVPMVIRVIQVIVVIQAAILTLVALVAFTFDPAEVDKRTVVLVSIVQLLLVAAMLITVWGMNKRYMWAYYLLTAVFIFNIVALLLTTRNVVQLVINAALLITFAPQRQYFLRK